MRSPIKKNSGFSLIEALVSLAIIAALTLGIYSLIILSLRITADNKAHVEAMGVANQKMEQIRNLPYADVGTLAGSPSGVIADDETIIGGGIYAVHTVIVWHDDEYDGTLASGTDTIFTDYKIATVEVSWQGKYGQKNVTVFSKIIPKTEEVSTGDGLLKILVVDANGNPVPDADIDIENILTGVPDVSLTSGAAGELSYAVPPGFEAYEIIVTKTPPPDYGIDRTYDRTAANPNPTKPHLTVGEGEKTEESFSIDILGNLIIHTITQDLPENWQANTDASLEAQSNARIAFSGTGYMYIVWEDFRDTSDSKLYAQKYDEDGDAQWLPDDVRISSANNQILPDILVDSSGNLYICWNDDSVGNQEAYLDRRSSVDGSPSWGGELKINVEEQNDDQMGARIALSETSPLTITVVWYDNRDADLDIYMQRYDESKNPLLTPEKRINSNPLADGTNQYNPAVKTGSLGDIYIAWSDNRTGNLDVYGTKISSSSMAQVWEKALNTNGGITDQYSPDMDIDSSNNIYIIWTDERNGDKDIYAQKYDSDGNALWASDVQINIGLNLADQYQPALAITGNDIIYIVWTDERNGDRDIYAQKYDTDGNSLWPIDIRVSISSTTSAEYNPDVTINPLTNKPYATWQSDANGNLDIYITEFDYFGGFSTTIPDIPIIVTGNKRIGDNPIIYEYNQEHTTDANGSLNLQLEWDAPGYTIILKSASTSYNLLLSEPTQPVEVLPNAASEIYLYLEL